MSKRMMWAALAVCCLGWAGQGQKGPAKVPDYLRETDPQDPHAAEAWLKAAASNGNPAAERMLGRLYERGPKNMRNIPESVRLYTLAAGHGDAWAMNNLGLMYESGWGVDEDIRKAGELLRASAEKGDWRGQFNFANWLAYYGPRPPQKNPEIQMWLERAAAQGDSEAMLRIAADSNGEGGWPDLPERRSYWYRRAAEAGDLHGMLNLGWAYENGVGVQIDGNLAIAWTTKAAEGGLAEAMTNLGILYDQGKVVPRDLGKSIAWFRKGDEAGSWTSAYELAIRYREGIGVTRDYGEALRLFRRSAGFGWGQAWLGLGHMYEDGFGAPKDYQKALDCYFMGARRWDETSVNNVAAYYEHGYGIPKNKVMAWCWFKIAVHEGSSHARINLERLEKSMGSWERLSAGREYPKVVRWLSEARAEEDRRVKEMLDK